MEFNLKHRWLNENGFGWKEGLYIYQVAEGGPKVTVEAKKEAPKGPEQKAEPAKPIEPVVFKQKENQAKALVEKTYKGFGQNPEAKALHDELDKWIDDTFNKQTEPFGLRFNYENARQQLLHGTEKGEGEGLGSELGKKTMEYFTKERPDEIIKILSERREITKAKELVEHNTLQSKLKEGESARDKEGVSPKDKLEAEQKIREAQTKIIENYLKGQKLPTEMAPYIVNVLNDTGVYKSDKPEDLKTSLDKALTDKNSTVIKDAVQNLIDKSPKMEATGQKINYISGLIKNVQEKFGIGDKLIPDIAKNLAQIIHIELKDPNGEISKENSPIFIMDSEGSVHSQAAFENRVLPEILVKYAKSQDGLKDLEKYAKEGTEKGGRREADLKDDVTDLGDLKDNKDLAEQIRLIKEMERQTKPLVEAASKARAVEKQAEPAAQKPAEKKKGAGADKPVEKEAETKLPEAERTALVDRCFKKIMEEIRKNTKAVSDQLKFMKSDAAKEFEKNPDSLLNDPGFEKFFKNILSRLPDQSLKDIEKGKDPSPEELATALKGAFLDLIGVKELKDADPAEITLLKNLKPNGKGIDEIFGPDCRIAEVISRTHEVKQEPGKPLTINGEVVTKIDDLAKYLSSDLKDPFNDAIKDGAPNVEKMSFNSHMNLESIKLGIFGDSMKRMDSLAKNPKAETKEGSEKLGTTEVIGVLLQMYGMLKAGDWESLNEAMEDFNSKPSKNPMKVMKECSDAYEKKIGEIAANTPATDLLEAYLKPRGPVADKLFPGAKKGEVPLGRYRGAICEPIAKQIGSKLGIEPIEKISKDGAQFIIDGNSGSEKVSYHIYKKDEKLMLGVGTFETKATTDSKGKETTSTTHSKPAEGILLADKADVKLGDLKKPSEIKPATPEKKPEDPTKYSKDDLNNLTKDKLDGLVNTAIKDKDLADRPDTKTLLELRTKANAKSATEGTAREYSEKRADWIIANVKKVEAKKG